MDFEAMRKELTFQLSDDPANVRLMNRLALANLETRDWDDAYLLFLKAVELEPNAEMLTNLACFYLEAGAPNNDGEWSRREEKAVELLEQAILLKPQSENPYAKLGEVYTALEDNDKAQLLLERALSFKEAMPIRNNYGVIMYRKGKFELAAASFLEAHLLRRLDYSYHPLYSYAMSLCKLGHMPKRAIAELEGAYSNLHSEISADEVAFIFYELGDYSAVIERLGASRQSFHPDWTLPYLYALIQVGDLAKAHDVYRQVIAQTSHDVEEAANDLSRTPEERDELVAYYRQRAEEYRSAWATYLGGSAKPEYRLRPSWIGECYFYGCVRHGRGDSSGGRQSDPGRMRANSE